MTTTTTKNTRKTFAVAWGGGWENKQTRESSNEGGIKKAWKEKYGKYLCDKLTWEFPSFYIFQSRNFHNFQVHTAAHVSKSCIHENDNVCVSRLFLFRTFSMRHIEGER